MDRADDPRWGSARANGPRGVCARRVRADGPRGGSVQTDRAKGPSRTDEGSPQTGQQDNPAIWRKFEIIQEFRV